MQATPLLIIDDDESFRATLGRSMARRGFAVSLAANPEEALRACAATPPEAIVLDLNLAGSSGLNLIRPLLDLAPNARLVVLTGYASIQTAVSAVKLGATQYLPKPASIADLLRALTVDEASLPPHHEDPPLTVRSLEWEHIQRALAANDGNIAATARSLRMHRRTLQRKLAKKRPPEPST